MNTNLLNQAPVITAKFIKTIPPTEFYSNILTRPKIANIYDKYYVPMQTQLQLSPEQALRAIMVNCYRYINMSIQDVTVLLVYGLDGLGRNDLDLTEQHLAEKLALQNPDKNDIDIINRIIAQVVTKLPADLREKLTPLLRLRMIQKLNEDLQHMMDYKVGKRLEELKQSPSPSNVAEPADIKFFFKEGFQSNMPYQNRLLANNTPTTTAFDNNFLKEEQDIRNSLGNETVEELIANGYSIRDIAKSAIDMRFGAGDYEEQLKRIDAMQANNRVTTDTIEKNVIKSTYTQKDPQLHMDAKTKQLYYFDDYSGVLIPISEVQKIKGETITSSNQLNNVLKDYNLSKEEVNKVLQTLQNKEDKINANHADESVTKKEHNNYLMYGIIALIVIVVIVVALIMLMRKRK